MPGPGAYTIPRETAKMTASYSMSPRHTSRKPDSEDNPGPGHFEVRTRIGEGPKFSCSPPSGPGRAAACPGPGAYDVAESETTRSRQPRCCFGNGSRGLKEKDVGNASSTPGPGAYSVSSNMGQGPQVSIKSRFQPGRTQVTPGPGAHGGNYTSFGDYKPSQPRPRMASTSASPRFASESISSS
mmetsp:Transcript_45945/g.146653  ORF Transcript_45945/g.146653 Transcript_45945/m.146653 type:complete len:184 (+) Transcript_45945:192-743(+)